MINSEATASIVLYNNDLAEIKRTLNCVKTYCPDITLYLIDNSLSNSLKVLSTSENIQYFHNPTNPGFGSAHNIAIQKAILLGSKYHFIINPDIYFKGDVITPMVDFMFADPSIGMMMPQILNEDGSVQSLPKLLPSPYSVLMRKIKRPNSTFKKFINRYELRFVEKDFIYNAPILSGCFTLLNLEAIKKIGSYDDKFFMYFEDWDLSRRMHQKYKTLYFPKVSVVHGYESGANKNKNLFKIFVKSAVHYFNKWGWFFDSERRKINQKTLEQFK
jgi:GT2 family glycosyltransferase